jgi:YbbR domain-containing protein
VRRLLAFLLGNWPLKLGAVALATVLYGGVVLSQNTRTWPGQVAIDVLNPPQNAAVLNFLGYVTDIEFRAPLDVASRLTSGSFHASVNLANVVPVPNGPPVEVPVIVSAVDASVVIVDYSPKMVNVTLDPVITQTRPVTVDRGQVPLSLNIGPPQVEPANVTLTGASSRVTSVRTVVARVTIDASGLNVDQEVDLQPLDGNGARVSGIQIDPARVRVRINVSHDSATVQLPVRVQLVGSPATSHQVSSVSVDPIVVSVSGESAVVKRLGGIATLPIDLAGRDASFSVDVLLDVPADVTVEGSTTVRVQVGIDVSQVSRTFDVGLEIRGARGDLLYTLGRPSVQVVVAGPATLVDGITPADLHAILQVAALPAGSQQVRVEVQVPAGTTLVSVAPTDVSVDVVAAPIVTPEPTPSPAPTTSPPPGSGSL